MPRVKYSPADAVYCANFILRMHTLHTWGFSSIQTYDKVGSCFLPLSPAEGQCVGWLIACHRAPKCFKVTARLLCAPDGQARCSSEESAQAPLPGDRVKVATRVAAAGQVIKDMVELVLCSTDAEASNMGLFFQHSLTTVARWRVRSCPPKFSAQSCCTPGGRCWTLFFVLLPAQHRARQARRARPCTVPYRLRIAIPHCAPGIPSSSQRGLRCLPAQTCHVSSAVGRSCADGSL